MARLKLAVLISGRGSNLQSLIDACAAPDFPAEIVTVLSNDASAAGLDRARAAGIPATVIDHHDFATREAFDEALSESIRAAGAELACLAGFMRLVTEAFLRDWRDRLINIHPSLLPSFGGLNTHARAIAAGVRFTGCTIHFVRAEMDAGPIIVQAVVPVLTDDTPDSLAARVLAAEHRAYPLAVRLIGEGRVRVVNEVAHIDGIESPQEVLMNPTGD
jgi:phosphoribosylglycinamide formyltransferase-1